MTKVDRRTRRRGALVGVLLVVALTHAWIVDEVARRMPSVDAAGKNDIKRIDVAFVHTLEVQAPPPAMTPPAAVVSPPLSRAVVVAASASSASAPARRRRTVSPPPERDRSLPDRVEKRSADAPAESASNLPSVATTGDAAAPQIAPAALARETDRVSAAASAPDDSAPDPSPTVAASAPPPAASGVARAPTVVGGGATTRAASAAAGGVDFEWPPSTRLTYSLVGNYRGEIEGSARVQWVRTEARYQVHMDVVIGPAFAPLMARRMTSDGELGARGLMPRRYQEETRIGFVTRRNGLQIDDRRVVLANGNERPAPAGVQDSASQFVQLSYLFSIDPSLLTPGASITVPVALPRRVDPWIYDVVAAETLATPIGNLETFHVKPRRDSPRPGELTAQAWYAPSLRYLPVRILIHQDDETFVDLLLKSAPMQGVAER